jgi:ribosomal protein S18 acetylase RimI-like enzyme
MLKNYPKEITLRDGTKAAIRPLKSDDTEALFELFKDMSPASRRFVYDDVTKKSVIEGWCKNLHYESVLPLVVVVGKKIVADATLHRRNFGPMHHLGRIRIVVKEEFLGKGISTLLVSEMIDIANKSKLVGLTCMLVEKEEGAAIEALEALGFKKSSPLINYVIDPEGKTYNAVIMVKSL